MSDQKHIVVIGSAGIGTSLALKELQGMADIVQINEKDIIGDWDQCGINRPEPMVLKPISQLSLPIEFKGMKAAKHHNSKGKDYKKQRKKNKAARKARKSKK